MRLILEFLKPHWRLCAVTMALSLLDVGGALLIPTLVGDLINGATGGAIGFDGLLRTGVWMVVVATVSGIAAIAGGWVCAVLTARVGRDLREAVYRKSLTLSVSDFRAFGVSSFTTRTTSDVSNIRFALLNFFQLVVPVPVVFAFALALAFGKDWVLGALLAAVLAVICALSVPIVRQAAGIFRLLQKQLDRIATVLLENITGVRVVRAFDKSAHEEARMEATFEDYRATGVQTVRLFAFMDGYLFSAINLFILAVLAVSGFRIEAGRFAPGDITAVIEYAWLALVYLQLALTVALTLPRAFECLDRIRAVFDHPPQIRDAPDCGPIPRQPEVLALHDVSFRYPDAEEPTLVGLDFVCRRGETTAIIGGTGSGKSTIASLFLRFNEATEGTVRFNGVDVREIPLARLRADIAYVQQRAWLFAGTVAERTFDFLDAAEERTDANAPLRLAPPRGSVIFSHVRFGYHPKRVLMDNVNLVVRPGQKVAIVGSTGAGKTTLVNLLMRFYDVNRGHILVDGTPISAVPRADLRRRFGMVLQDTWLFEGTVAENIAYARPDATRDEVVRAAKLARADHFIRALPQGYDTRLKTGAETLSVGQRQLLTIARVFLADPPMLILDEATSSVDTRTEAEIAEAMRGLMRGRTAFVIAHRLSTIRDADLILYMERGDITEKGTHEELLRKGGAYAALYASQFA